MKSRLVDAPVNIGAARGMAEQAIVGCAFQLEVIRMRFVALPCSRYKARSFRRCDVSERSKTHEANVACGEWISTLRGVGVPGGWMAAAKSDFGSFFTASFFRQFQRTHFHRRTPVSRLPYRIPRRHIASRGVAMGPMAWEVIPDDVLVPRRTHPRHRVVASDVQVFGRKRNLRAADIATAAADRAGTWPISADDAGPFEKRARTPSEIKARGKVEARVEHGIQRATAGLTDRPPTKPTTSVPEVSKPKARKEPTKQTTKPMTDLKSTEVTTATPKAQKPDTPSSTQPEAISYGTLSSMDEGMARAHKHSRKRARDAQTLLKRAVSVKDVKFFNRLIRDFGNDKQLGFAEEAFNRITQVKGLERNVYSHTNMLNACVRVGELEKARLVWKNMLHEKDCAPNEVSYTVFIKGLAQEGALDEATELLETMCSVDSDVTPNVRTFSTLLRNCVRHADGVNADRCFDAMRSAGVEPDVASFEYLVKTKCAAFDAEEAWNTHQEMERLYLEATPQLLAALATVSSITGDVEKAREACVAAKAAIEANGAGVVLSSEGGNEGLFGKGMEGTNGIDTDDFEDGDDDMMEKEVNRNAHGTTGQMSESVRAFLRLRNSDAARQVSDVEEFLGKGDEHVKAVASDVKNGHESKKSLVKVIEGEGDQLDFSKTFSNSLPVKLEVCSGHGDWVVDRCVRDKGKYNWLAIEMRRNRVRMTWAKGVRQRLGNLAVLRGMAHEMIDSRIPDDALTEIHVNYPDPPEWVGSKQCLVDLEFLKQAHRALKKETDLNPNSGHLTLVTDDPGYAMRMCRELSKVPELFSPTANDGAPFVAGIPSDYGGSYFDEMWKNGRQTDRYYMRYKVER